MSDASIFGRSARRRRGGARPRQPAHIAAAVLMAVLGIAAAAPCAATIACGDCDTDSVVRIDELISAVSNALSSAPGRPQEATGPFETIPPGYIVHASTFEYVVRRAIADFAAANMLRILTEFRVIPHFEGGQLAAYRLLDVPDDSLLDQLGFAPDDYLEEVNGVIVPADPLDFAEILSADRISLQIRRGPTRVQLGFTIVP